MTVPTGMRQLHQRSGTLARAPKGFRSLPHPQRYTAAPGDFVGGGLRSWLAVRWTRTAALYLTAPPSCGCSALYRGPKAQRGVPRSGLWSEEWESPRSGVRYASGTGSERAQGRERSGVESPASQGPFSIRKGLRKVLNG
ncbi:MAG: hypothetical protein WBB46_12645 [Candidatus Deferrimicrobiaceae bacterium]